MTVRANDLPPRHQQRAVRQTGFPDIEGLRAVAVIAVVLADRAQAGGEP